MLVMSLLVIIYLYLVSDIVTSSINPRIIGGDDANIEEFPYLVSLQRISDQQHICGGAIISDRCILTAAHCFRKEHLTMNNLIVYAGTTYLKNENCKKFLPHQVFIHPQFVGINNEARYSYDLAILVVKHIIQLGNLPNVAKLPTKKIRHGDVGMLAGWGYTFYPSRYSSNRLQKVRMNVYDTHRCRILVPFNLQNDQFCGYRQMGIGACIGDSGSPLVRDNTIIGIASQTVPCAQGIPDMYTDVKYHIDFINALLQKIT